jgi:hypothetical protein
MEVSWEYQAMKRLITVEGFDAAELTRPYLLVRAGEVLHDYQRCVIGDHIGSFTSF